jgi:1-acyl-sn-glycerol-3-phosphate acyltransferase
MPPYPIFRLPGESFWSVHARRAISVPVVFLSAVALWVGAPLWLLVAATLDLIRAPSGKWPRARGLAFFLIFVTNEIWGVGAALGLWLLTLGGRLVSRERYRQLHVSLQRAWSQVLFRGSMAVFSVRLHVEGQDRAARGPLVLLPRHSSTADTILASGLVANPHRLYLGYVFKRELLWDPCLDIVGRRLPNAFVDRSGKSSAEATAAVAELGRSLDEHSGVLLYPEGTRFSSEKKQRAIERLRRSGRDDLAERAEGFVHVLPPRLGGISALLDSAPEADLVFMAHTGFEAASSFRRFLSGELERSEVRVALWRIPAASVPDTARESWFYDRWAEVDRWIEAQQRLEAP